MPAHKVFISYSHKDEPWKDRLVTHLAVLEQEGLLDLWHDRRIAGGASWLDEIRNALEDAGVGVLLVSADFLTSPFTRREEVSRLLERRAEGGLVILPVIVRDCAWDRVSWLAPIQARPRDGRPLASFGGNGRDRELKKITEEVLSLVQSGRHAQAPPQGSEPRPERWRQQAPPVAEPALAPAPAQAALHQLPSPPVDFTGREAELGELRRKLGEGGGAAIFGVRGAGGIGKTALALKLAAELAPRYPAIVSWNLGDEYERLGELARAAKLMQTCVDYETSIGHVDAEKDAARLAALRARMASGGGASEARED